MRVEFLVVPHSPITSLAFTGIRTKKLNERSWERGCFLLFLLQRAEKPTNKKLKQATCRETQVAFCEEERASQMKTHGWDSKDTRREGSSAFPSRLVFSESFVCSVILPSPVSSHFVPQSTVSRCLVVVRRTYKKLTLAFSDLQFCETLAVSCVWLTIMSKTKSAISTFQLLFWLNTYILLQQAWNYNVWSLHVNANCKGMVCSPHDKLLGSAKC